MTTTARTAHADQLAAREREFDRRARKVAAIGLILFALLGAFSLLAALGVLPAAPWSPLGQ